MSEELTIEELLERRNLVKPLELSYETKNYGKIKIKKCSPDKVAKIISEAQEGQYRAYCKLIYECCPIFHDKKMHEKFNPTEPFDVVDKFFDTDSTEIFRFGNYILQIYGYIERKTVEELKK